MMPRTNTMLFLCLPLLFATTIITITIIIIIIIIATIVIIVTAAFQRRPLSYPLSNDSLIHSIVSLGEDVYMHLYSTMNGTLQNLTSHSRYVVLLPLFAALVLCFGSIVSMMMMSILTSASSLCFVLLSIHILLTFHLPSPSFTILSRPVI